MRKTSDMLHPNPMIPLIAFAFVVAGCSHLYTRTAPKTEKETAPQFTLQSADGTEFSLDGVLAKGPAVLVFYRGYW